MPAGKLLVLKGKDDSTFWLWGPYVKLFYRARGLGTSLVDEALRVISGQGAVCVHAPVHRQETLLKFYKQLGFVKDKYSQGLSWVPKKVI